MSDVWLCPLLVLAALPLAFLAALGPVHARPLDAVDPSEILRRAAARLGLRVVEGPERRPPRLEGQVDGVTVVVDPVPEGHRIRARTGAEGLVLGPARTPPAGAPTGDEGFDTLVHTEGDPVARSVLVDPAVRGCVWRAVLAGARHEAGWWELGPSRGFDTVDPLVERVRLLVAAAAVGTPTPLRAHLAAATDDPSPRLRARAAELLVDRLEQVWSQETAEALAPHLPPGRAAARLAAHRRDLPTLRALLADPDPAVRRAAALPLSTLVAPGREPPLEAALCGLLAHGDVEVSEALGRIGTATSLPRLQRVVDEGATASIRTTARLAIDAIRGRIRARPGDVSLATDAGGGLSEGAPARGAVSEGVRRPRTPEG